ncbi:MAG: S1C family serine protease [Dehalococcoidales bacterium]|nr:S1C family serine protease [Dehalococcoidales bacterium]
MKNLIIICAIFLIVLIPLSLVGCHQSTPDVVELIAIFLAEPGAPLPIGTWGAPDGLINPHPDQIQRVFNPGDKMYFGMRISSKIEEQVTFSRFTYFNKETGEEIDVGSSSDLMEVWESGQVGLLAFNNPWLVPDEPGEYQVRLYLDDAMIASARFEVSPRVTREAVVLVKAQDKDGGFDQISGFIISTDGKILTFYPGAPEIVRWEVVLSDGRSFEASIFKTHEVWGFTCLKIEAQDLTPLQLADYHKLQPPANDSENYELYPYTMREGLTLYAAGYDMKQHIEMEVEVLDPHLRLPLNPVRYPERTFPVVKLDTGGVPVIAGGPVVIPSGQVIGQVVAFNKETDECFMVTINLIEDQLFESYTSGTIIREYPREIVKAAFEDIQDGITEIGRERGQGIRMEIGYNYELIHLGFINEADPEIVEMAKAIVDSQVPCLRLLVMENIVPLPADIIPLPVPQNGD